MKNKFFEIIGLITIIVFVSLACGSDSDSDNGDPMPVLPGTIAITPAGPVVVGETLVAVYTPVEGEQITYQWKKNGSNINGSTDIGYTSSYTPQEAGDYSVTVSAEDFQSKTSNIVSVTTSTGGGSGTDVDTKYRGNYTDHASEWTGPLPEDDVDIDITVGENTITWTGGSNGSFANVSTDSDQTMNFGLPGTWAYVYSGNNKIGIVCAYDAYGFAIKKHLVIGQQYVEAWVYTVGSAMGIESVDYSDIDASVKNISGEI